MRATDPNSPPKQGAPVDPRPFLRQVALSLGSRGDSGTSIERLESILAGLARFDTDPRLVGFDALHAMGCHPAIYLAERTISGICRRKDLYSVKHADDKIKAETEEWLWPILPGLLSSAARAFAYGSMAVVFNWNDEPGLAVEVNGRKRTNPTHVHYTSTHELNPSLVEVEARGDFLLRLRYQDQAYDRERAHVFRWDPEFGSWCGQSARRRAWRDYAEEKIIRKLEARYLERSVDSPYVGWAPAGSVEIDGVEYDNIDMVGRLLMALRGSGAAVFPGEQGEGGQRLFGAETLEIPDRSGIWNTAINRRHASMMIAYLVSPSLGGVDELGAGEGKTQEDMLDEHIEDLATWCAENLTEVVEKVHAKNYDPRKVPPPEVLSTDVGKAAARKILQGVLGLVNTAADGKVATFVDVRASLDKLGVPLLDQADVEREKQERLERAAQTSGAGAPGPDRDPNSDREDRRDNADTREGEDDTGAPRDDRGERVLPGEGN